MSVALSSLLCFLLEHILNCTHSLNHGLVKLYFYKFFNHLLMSSQVHLTSRYHKECWLKCNLVEKFHFHTYNMNKELSTSHWKYILLSFSNSVRHSSCNVLYSQFLRNKSTSILEGLVTKNEQLNCIFYTLVLDLWC